MKNCAPVYPLLLGLLVLTGVASAQVDATHSPEAGARIVRVPVTMRHVGARTTPAVVVAPPAAEASLQPASEASLPPATTRAIRLPRVHFRH